MKLKLFIIFTALFVSLAFLVAQQMTLSAIEKRIAKEHPVPEISYQELFRLFVSDSLQQYVLFDVREQDEYQKSHLRNAIWVDPDLTADKFAELFNEEFKRKNLIFYCSVGYRSSIFLERVDSLAQKNGALSLANLRGGIFRWYNENLPVYNTNGETNEVHPYNAFWGKLLVKKRTNKKK
jgi:rhodanese-related sulfurtransferase